MVFRRVSSGSSPVPSCNPPEHYTPNNPQSCISFTHERSTMKGMRVFWSGLYVHYKLERANEEEDDDVGKITKEMA